MHRPILLTLALLVLAAFAPTAHAGFAGKQAYFDVTGTGHWGYSSVTDVTPAGECPFDRGRRAESQSVDFRFSRRVKVQHAYGRTYVTPVGRGARLIAPATFRQSFEETMERMWCESSSWTPDESPQSTSKTCKRNVWMVLAVERRRALLFGVNRSGAPACRFSENFFDDPYPRGVEKLNLAAKMPMSRLLGRSKRPFTVRRAARRQTTSSQADSGSVWSTTTVAEGNWNAKWRRRTAWRAWR